MAFQGEFHNTIDPKGRASIPARFRELLAQQGDEYVVVTKNLERGLTAYPVSRWQEVVDGVGRRPASPAKESAFRFFIAPAVECLFDKQGRIQLPQSLRTYAALEKEVVVLGMFDKIEIYSQGRYEQVMNNSGDLLRNDAAIVAEMGF
ncbi:MAG: division/cell wall cluster transcriptional repressor MraZ [Desulfuromonadales bacterium]|jgi:MraZ protein